MRQHRLLVCEFVTVFAKEFAKEPAMKSGVLRGYPRSVSDTVPRGNRGVNVVRRVGLESTTR